MIENYDIPAAVIECELRKEIFTLKMQLAAAKRELNQFTEAWLLSWNKRLEEFKAEQKQVIEEWKATHPSRKK